MMTPSGFLAALKRLRFDNTFNPYVHSCPLHDGEDAPGTRSRTLESILQSAARIEVDAIWIGRDLGHRGGRRTGLALTDDVHFESHLHRWGFETARPTKGTLVAERTAAVIWEVLSHVHQSVFLWNVFPLHPHPDGDAFSNRAHNAPERRAGQELLFELVKMLKPARLVAIGNDAYNVAAKLVSTEPVFKVRHPSYGGQAEFAAQMEKLYGLEEKGREVRLL